MISTKTMQKDLFVCLFAAATVALSSFNVSARTSSLYVNITDYITESDSSDMAPAIQRAIDENPNRVIFFPDGVYTIASPIITPAEPTKSVSLELSGFAKICPADGWNHDEAMVRMGGKDNSRTIIVPGSNYYFSGGILDGRGIAKGISIDSGRETVIRDTSIKNASVGIHIKRGSNAGSSDADIHDVNITGNMAPDCVGILVDGLDNTLRNIRIYRTQTGVLLNSGGNSLRDIHPLYASPGDDLYANGYGFVDTFGNNWYDYCYSDQCATGFVTPERGSVYSNCFAYWYSNRGEKHVAFKSPGAFNSVVSNFTMGLDKNNATKENVILEEGDMKGQGKGVFDNLRNRHPELVAGDAHKPYTTKEIGK